MRRLGNVTILERPLRVPTLLSAVHTALRSRRRQYQTREHLAERARDEEALRLADRRKDEFLATLGHELRNPLTPLLYGMHLLRLSSLEDVRDGRIMEAMERQISHLVRLVDDLLEVSRITRGLIEVLRDPLDLVSVVRAAVDTCRPVVEAAGHELMLDLPETSIPVAGDQVRLIQVFANLLTNAAKYTHDGGQIRVTATQAAGRAIVSVRDNGIGIPASHLASVFDMFMQVDRSNRRAQGGLGIGLTLVRTLVEMHGGRVEARSAGPGKGSEFLVELPVLGESVSEQPQPTALRRLPDRRILVVDDNHDAAETLGALLSALGATVSIVYNGRSALESLDQFDPDTLLLDIGMPEMDGYEVARRVRATPNHAKTLLIALTGWGQDQDYRQSRAAGFDHHMVKPPDIDKLRDILTRA
jgi:signal transduction histidine kinase